jgi:excisionase family DNA binding protein
MVVENRAANSSKPQSADEEEEAPDLPRDWMSLREFARTIGVTYQTALRYKDDNHIEVYRVGGRFRISVEEVQRFLREGNRLPTRTDEGQ